MGRISKMADLVEEIRKIDIDLMAEAPRSVWRVISDVDDCLDMLKYLLGKLEDKYVEASLGD